MSVVCYVNINMSNIKQTTLLFTFSGKQKNLRFELSNFDVPFPVDWAHALHDTEEKCSLSISKSTLMTQQYRSHI